MSKNEQEDILETLMLKYRIYPSIRQFPFAKETLKRNWKADFCWPEYKLIVELQGGNFINGRHNRGAGMEKDYERMNAAQLLGYRVLQFTPNMIRKQEFYVIDTIRSFLGLEPIFNGYHNEDDAPDISVQLDFFDLLETP